MTKFGWVAWAKPGNEAQCRIYGGWVKKSDGPFFAVCGQSLWNFWRLQFPNAIPVCLRYVPVRRYSSTLSCEVIESVENRLDRSFDVPILLGGDSQILVMHFQIWVTSQRSKVWLSFVRWAPRIVDEKRRRR